MDLLALAARVNPTLVDINTRLSDPNAGAAGTGIVLSSSGEILTNNHVIDGATSISVTDVGDGQTYPATVVGYDRTHDIAVLQLQGASGLPTSPIGDSGRVAVGDAIAAIGNAGGLGGTPSIAAGTVSALHQTITVSDDTTGKTQQLAGLIQVAAHVQPGDSGGPLVNGAGQGSLASLPRVPPAASPSVVRVSRSRSVRRSLSANKSLPVLPPRPSTSDRPASSVARSERRARRQGRANEDGQGASRYRGSSLSVCQRLVIPPLSGDVCAINH